MLAKVMATLSLLTSPLLGTGGVLVNGILDFIGSPIQPNGSLTFNLQNLRGKRVDLRNQGVTFEMEHFDKSWCDNRDRAF